MRCGVARVGRGRRRWARGAGTRRRSGRERPRWRRGRRACHERRGGDPAAGKRAGAEKASTRQAGGFDDRGRGRRGHVHARIVVSEGSPGQVPVGPSRGAGRPKDGPARLLGSAPWLPVALPGRPRRSRSTPRRSTRWTRRRERSRASSTSMTLCSSSSSGSRQLVGAQVRGARDRRPGWRDPAVHHERHDVPRAGGDRAAAARSRPARADHPQGALVPDPEHRGSSRQLRLSRRTTRR